MHKQKYVFLILLFCVWSLPGLFSQISINPSTGCLPAGLTNAVFKYTGTGTPTNVTWNYGDGSPTSSADSTQHSYPNAGTYTVTYHATINGLPVTYTAVATVYPPPSGSINPPIIPANHCAPMTVNFSANGTGNNLVFTWAFGDLSGGSGPSTSHTYNSAGTFTPNITIQNTLTGCFINLNTTPVNVSGPAIVIINANPSFTCAPTLVTTLDGSSSTSGSPSGGGLTYSWNLGPFGTSSQANTGSVVFQPVGTYIVTLTVTDNNGCSTSATKAISLLSPTLSAVVPPSVCIVSQMTMSPAVFSATVSSNEPSTTWDMGDGTILNFPLPLQPNTPPPVLVPNVAYSGTIHTYSTPGLKTVTIKAMAGQCITTVTHTIMVEKITPQFSFSPPSATCSPSFVLSYTNQTTINTGNPMLYTWHVNEWQQGSYYTSNAVNPTFTVTQGSLNPYVNYGHPPYYIGALLTVTSQPLGCVTSIAYPTDTIQRPTAIFETDRSEGCGPLTVSFTDFSTTKITGAVTFPIVSYTWNFGASPSSTLAGIAGQPSAPIPPVSFTYTNPGIYYPTLSITTTGGCSHTSYAHTITVVNPPAISYTLPPSPVCAGQNVQIQLSSPQAVEHWHVESDNGYFSGCVNNASPTWHFDHPGVQDFTISAYYHSCLSTTTIPAGVTVKGPFARFRYETNCNENQKKIKFHYTLEDVTNAVLDFGDGSPAVTLTASPGSTVVADTSHIYAAAGDYTATLTSYNSGNACGALINWTRVGVRQMAVDFAFKDSVVCRDAAAQATITTAVQVFTSCGRGFTWSVDNGATFQTATHSFVASTYGAAAGMHTVTLIVKDTNNCMQTVTKKYRVSLPAPDFSFNQNPICFSNMPLVFTNLTPQSPDSVKNYTYFMGDSVLYPLPPPYHTVLTNTNSYNYSPSFSYPTLGGLQSRTFTVSLFATNIYGCSNYKRHVVTVNDPIIDVHRSDYKGCVPAAITFSFNAASTHTNYNINWGDATPTLNITSYNTNATYTNVHVYTSPGTYTPVFTVTDFGGCKKTLDFAVQPMIIQTYPVSTFTFFNKINGAPGPGPFCAPLSPSVVSIRNSPYPLNYVWDLFGAGGGGPTFDSTAFTNYPDGQATYTISLKVTTIPSGCASYSQQVVQVYAPHINFKIIPDSLKRTYCLGSPINLSLTGVPPGVQYYIWDFSDGIVQPHIYPVPGINSTFSTVCSNTVYPEFTNGDLKIQVVGYAGNGNKTCQETHTLSVKIVRPLADFKRNNELLLTDTAHCLNKPDLFRNLSTNNINTSMNYTWTLGDGATSTNTDVSHTYAAAGTYTVRLDLLESQYSCVASVSKKMVVFPLPSGSLSVKPDACPQTPFPIVGGGSPGVSGILSGTLLPTGLPVNFAPDNTFSLMTTASVSTTYTLDVIDNNGCENSAATGSVFVQQPAPAVHWDTTVVIGQPTPLNAYLGPGYSYTWTPEVAYLNCDTCRIYNPVSTTTADITYSVSVEDGHQCAVVQSTYRIHVEIKVSLDVPTAFTPNGDGVNDIIYPNGWGLKKLNYFRVFNRWGQLVFESNDLSVGWDGIFRGVPQNIETYVYQVSAETFLDQQPTLTKTGTFKLLR